MNGECEQKIETEKTKYTMTSQRKFLPQMSTTQRRPKRKKDRQKEVKTPKNVKIDFES